MVETQQAETKSSFIIENKEHFELEIENAKADFQTMADSGKIELTQKSEMGEVIENLNRDKPQDNTGLTDIDLRANLHPSEMSSLLVLDFLITHNFLPAETSRLTRQKKRLSVSKYGIGRRQIVQIATAKTQQEILNMESAQLSMSKANKENR